MLVDRVAPTIQPLSVDEEIISLYNLQLRQPRNYRLQDVEGLVKGKTYFQKYLAHFEPLSFSEGFLSVL